MSGQLERRTATPEDGITAEDLELELIADPDIDDDLAQELLEPPEFCDAQSASGVNVCTYRGKRWVGSLWLCGSHARMAERKAAKP